MKSDYFWQYWYTSIYYAPWNVTVKGSRYLMAQLPNVCEFSKIVQYGYTEYCISLHRLQVLLIQDTLSSVL